MKPFSKRLLLFALVASGVIAVAMLVTHGVGASEQSELSYDATISATASVTAPPPWQPTILATQTFPSNFTCPTGNPIGWGTLTPNPAWNALCGQCIFTPFPTGTVAPPTACPTIMVGGTPGFDCGLLTSTATPVLPGCIIPTGTPLATSTTISPGEVDVYQASINYVGSWSACGDRPDTGESCKYSMVADSYYSYMFTGNRVEVLVIFASGFGNADVYLDGSLVGSFPTVGTLSYNNVIYDSGAITQSSHVIMVKVQSSPIGNIADDGSPNPTFKYWSLPPTPESNTVTCDPGDSDCTQDSPQHITLHAVDSSTLPGNWFYNGAFPFQSSIVGTFGGTVHTCYPFSDPQACQFIVSIDSVPATDYGYKLLWDDSAAITPYEDSNSISKDVTVFVSSVSGLNLGIDSGAGAVWTWTYTIDVYAYITCLGTGTPTPGPTCLDTGGSYCGCVDAVTTCTDFCYTGFGPTGNGVCVDIGPYSITLFGIDLEIPWIAHLCLEEWLFGTAIIFGVSFSMDVVIFVVLVAWVVRNIVL